MAPNAEAVSSQREGTAIEGDRRAPIAASSVEEEQEGGDEALTEMQAFELVLAEAAALPGGPLSEEVLLDRCLPEDFVDDEASDADAMRRALARVTNAHLDRERITSLGTLLRPMQALTNLYVQHNRLTTLAPLADLPTLRFVCAAGNRLENLKGIADLPNLLFLDVTDNAMRALALAELPPTLAFADLRAGNGFGAAPDSRAKLIAALPKLKVLDKRDVDEAERESAGQVGDDDGRGGTLHAPASCATAGMEEEPAATSEAEQHARGGHDHVQGHSDGDSTDGDLDDVDPVIRAGDAEQLRAALQLHMDPLAELGTAGDAVVAEASSNLRRQRDKVLREGTARRQEVRELAAVGDAAVKELRQKTEDVLLSAQPGSAAVSRPSTAAKSRPSTAGGARPDTAGTLRPRSAARRPRTAGAVDGNDTLAQKLRRPAADAPS